MHSCNVNKLTKIDNTFGMVLRKKRLCKKYTQEALSIESGLSRAYISELEMGHIVPSLYSIFKLAGALKIRVAYLINEIEDLI